MEDEDQADRKFDELLRLEEEEYSSIAVGTDWQEMLARAAQEAEEAAAAKATAAARAAQASLEGQNEDSSPQPIAAAASSNEAARPRRQAALRREATDESPERTPVKAKAKAGSKAGPKSVAKGNASARKASPAQKQAGGAPDSSVGVGGSGAATENVDRKAGRPTKDLMAFVTDTEEKFAVADQGSTFFGEHAQVQLRAIGRSVASIAHKLVSAKADEETKWLEARKKLQIIEASIKAVRGRESKGSAEFMKQWRTLEAFSASEPNVQLRLPPWLLRTAAECSTSEGFGSPEFMVVDVFGKKRVTPVNSDEAQAARFQKELVSIDVMSVLRRTADPLNKVVQRLRCGLTQVLDAPAGDFEKELVQEVSDLLLVVDPDYEPKVEHLGNETKARLLHKILAELPDIPPSGDMKLVEFLRANLDHGNPIVEHAKRTHTELEQLARGIEDAKKLLQELQAFDFVNVDAAKWAACIQLLTDLNMFVAVRTEQHGQLHVAHTRSVNVVPLSRQLVL